MPKTSVIQNSFTTGVISPTLMGRIDIAKYYNALKTGNNITLMPHGGLKRRAGTVPCVKSHDSTLGYAATEIYFTNKVRLEAFVFNIEQKYLIVFDLATITVFKGTEKLTSISVGSIATFNEQKLKEMDVVQYADTMIIVHPELAPLKLVRGATETDWTLEVIKFINVPMFDFTGNFLGQRELFRGDGVEKDFVLIYTKPPFSVSVNGVHSDDVAYDKDVGKITFTTVPAAAARIEVISGAGVVGMKAAHTYEDVWSAARGYPKTVAIHQGRLYFGGTFSKPITVMGSVVNSYFDFNLGGGEADMGIWDTLATGTFDDITNIESARTLQAFTQSGEYYNPANPITPATSAWKRQTAYGADRQGLIQIDGATYFVDRSKHAIRQFMYSNDEDAYVSPNVGLLADHIITDVRRMAVSRGAKQDIANLIYAVNGDGTLAVLNTMRTEGIQGWSRWTTEGQYRDVATVDEDVYFLIDRGYDAAGSPKGYIEKLDDTAILDHEQEQGEGADKFEGDGVTFIFKLVNSKNGKFLAYVDEFEVEPQPSYDSIENTVTFLIAPAEFSKIVIVPTDSTSNTMNLLTSASELWGFLSKKGNFFYEGKTHPVKDGINLRVDFEKYHHYLQTGFNFIPDIETVNLNKDTAAGSLVNRKKRLVRVQLNLYKTLGITVENVRLADKKFVMSFNHQLEPFTGVKKVFLLGYSEQNSIRIRQEVPFPFTLLQIETEIKY